MTTGADISEYQSIEVDSIQTGPEQTRVSKKSIEEGIDELADSIERFGLLHPVTVFQEDDKYILVAGQRRLLAIQQLEWERIPARVLPSRPDPVEAKAISFSENFVRRALTTSERKEACLRFYRQYGSLRVASQALKIPYAEVRDYVRRERLHEEMKKLVDNGEITVDEAIRAQDICEQEDGTIDIEAAKRAAMELKTFTRDQKSHLREIQKDEPGLSPDEKIEEAKKPRKNKRYIIVIAMKYAEGLQKLAAETDRTEAESAEMLIIEGLASGGYV